jgi:hypothetical protein
MNGKGIRLDVTAQPRLVDLPLREQPENPLPRLLELLGKGVDVNDIMAYGKNVMHH